MVSTGIPILSHDVAPAYAIGISINGTWEVDCAVGCTVIDEAMLLPAAIKIGSHDVAPVYVIGSSIDRTWDVEWREEIVAISRFGKSQSYGNHKSKNRFLFIALVL